MNWKHNPNRIREVSRAEGVRGAAETLLSYRNKEVLQVVAWGWGIALLMAFSLLGIVRVALTMPLPWKS